MSDLHDIVILSVKMQKESCSKLGSQCQQQTILECILFMYVFKNTNIAGIKFFTIKNNVVLSIEDTVSAKTDVNG